MLVADEIENSKVLTPNREMAMRLIRSAAQALAQTDSPREMDEIRDRLHVAETYFKRQRGQLANGNLITAQRLRTEHKLGTWLDKNVRPGNPQLYRDDTNGRLPDGISRAESSRWQKIAAIPEPAFESWIAEQLDAERELSTYWAVIEAEPYVKAQQHDRLKEEVGEVETGSITKIDDSRLTIIHGDACELSNLVSGAQLIFTSPPYNVGIEYGEHDDALDPAEYEALMRQVFTECYETLVVGGRIGVVVPFGVDRNPYVPVVPMMLRLLDDAGFTLRGQIVWDKATTGNRTTWGSWLSASNPALRDRTECIVVAHKVSPDLEIKGAGLLTDAEQFTQAAQDYWQIPAANATRIKHPAPFPVALAERFIRFYGYAGCKVVDPFMGSGSTLLAALRLGCEAIGIDIDATYCALARERIQEELADVDLPNA